MKLDERKEHILDFIVRDYIKTANPVSSGRISGALKTKQSLAGSPATIRNIMLELDEEGYLHQPYTSAGRAPTQKGYRYFVDNLMDIGSPDAYIRHSLDKIVENLECEMNSAFENLSKVLAGHLRLFSGIGFLDEEDKFFGRGLPDVLREPEFEEKNLAAEFAGFAEDIAKNLHEAYYQKESEKEMRPNININSFASVSIFFNNEDFGRCIIFSAGPKRMDYERAVSTLKYTVNDIIKSKNKKNGRQR